ncbi:TetR/AcrR family transcriptional regulator [Vibrio maerlii]|uniref:TetR/AcrR family transcriptional regulator n=1 Tax=Vibrio maerlii TaxID=2231648 RepID=UPI0019CFF574|nr:TetR/AcrR family transcriptional regulator [Vibrio maerlii]
MTDTTLNDKREQILQSAESLVAQSGFQGLSMQKLANEAGVAAGTIYRYFKDKDDLLIQLRLHVATRLATAVQANVTDDMPLKLRYRTMWLNIWKLAASNTSALNSRVQYESLPCSEGHSSREQEREMFAKVEQMFVEGKQQGIFRPLANEILAALSLEVSVVLARKHAANIYQLSEADLDAAIEASWDAIIKH